MIHRKPITHEFVDEVPPVREEGKLYISIKFRTMIHSCFCGCGAKIVTPIRPTKWKLTFDGDNVSLSPSVGNWSYPCRSHYIIKNGVAIPAGDMPDHDIEAGRRRDQKLENRYFGLDNDPDEAPTPSLEAELPLPPPKGFWNWLLGRK